MSSKRSTAHAMSSAREVFEAVVDASAIVDLVVGTEKAAAISTVLSEFAGLHAPAHLDAEVLSALGRLHRTGSLSARQVERRLEAVAEAPIERHPLSALLRGAWRRRERLRLVDALYVELAVALKAQLVTTDARLADAAGVVPL